MAKRKRKRKPRARGGSKRRRKRALGAAATGLTVVGALVYALLGPELRELGGLGGAAPPARGEAVRVVSWNLANFRGEASGHDLERMREVIEELDPDVLAVQEVKDVEALAALLPDWQLAMSSKGGRGHQLLGLAFRPDRIELLEQTEHPELSVGGRVRPAFSAYLRAKQGPDFWLVVVHLKAMPEGIELRREQWPTLAEVAADTLERGAGAGDRDLVILGDFNTTGPPGSGAAGPRVEQRELGEVLGAVGLRRLGNATGCSAYYDGARRDAWKEPSEIDLVWVRDLDEALSQDARVHSGTHCAAEACEDLRSTEAYPNRDYEVVSDHCPVVLDLTAADDD